MINLSREEIQFMLEELTMPKHLMKTLLDVIGKREARISDATADELRDLCAERLDTHGFGSEYEPTVVGKNLEYLIDKLYVG